MSSENSASNKPVAIVGAGLAGALTSAFLAKRGFKVEVYEKRSDMRLGGPDAGRSINLALSERGLNALRSVGLERRVRELCIPMRGRMIHDPQGGTHLQPYGQEGQYINSVSRRLLNELLMDTAEAEAGVSYHFHKECAGFSLETGALRFRDDQTGEYSEVEPSVAIAADGAFSAMRYRMQKTPNFEYSQSFLGHGYKELTIPPGPGGSWRIEREALHIWPRQDFMMIALPNLDGSFTCTLFMAMDGEGPSFASLGTPQQVQEFFETQFPDAVALMPTLIEDFFGNPTGGLVTIRCAPYHWEDKALLIGDAAHAIVPFYGQGMNAAFEDCFELDRLIQEHGPEWDKVLPAFTQRRKPNADAIAELALYNYHEMRALVNSPWFVWRKKLERQLHRAFPSRWVPLYSMVTFSNRPYAESLARSKRQDELLSRALKILLVLAALAVVGVIVWALQA